MLYQTQNPHGGDIYGEPVKLDFSANINPYGTPEGVKAAVVRSLDRMDRYPDPYCRKLVSAIAKFEQVPESRILCGNGAAELIYAYCEAVHPKKVLEPVPTFSEYALGLARTGTEIVQYPLREEKGFALDLEFTDVIRREKPDAVFLCNPNNPTGKLINPDVLDEILDACRETDSRLFLDECFLDLTDRGESLKHDLDGNPQLLILKAFTKSYGMAGVRLGYCLSADPDVLHAMSQAVQPWNVSSPAQAAGIAALKERDFLKKTKDVIRLERSWLKVKLEQFGFWVCPSQVNFLLFKAPASLAGDLRKQGIAIRDCSNYPTLGPGWFRIAVKLHTENETLIGAIARIAERTKSWQKTL